jgi:hypothetical protein
VLSIGLCEVPIPRVTSAMPLPYLHHPIAAAARALSYLSSQVRAKVGDP